MSYLATKFIDVFMEQMHGMSVGFNLAVNPCFKKICYLN